MLFDSVCMYLFLFSLYAMWNVFFYKGREYECTTKVLVFILQLFEYMYVGHQIKYVSGNVNQTFFT
jgi:hypothetical protein